MAKNSKRVLTISIINPSLNLIEILDSNKITPFLHGKDKTTSYIFSTFCGKAFHFVKI